MWCPTPIEVNPLFQTLQVPAEMQRSCPSSVRLSAPVGDPEVAEVIPVTTVIVESCDGVKVAVDGARVSTALACLISKVEVADAGRVAPLPEYVAETEYVPAFMRGVVRVQLAAPLATVALHSVLPLVAKVTVPESAVPTVALKVTGLP